MHFIERSHFDVAVHAGKWTSTYKNSNCQYEIYTWERNRPRCEIVRKIIVLIAASLLLCPLASQDFRNRWKSVFDCKEVKLVYLRIPAPAIISAGKTTISPAIVTPTPPSASSSSTVVMRSKAEEEEEERKVEKAEIDPGLHRAQVRIARFWRHHHGRQMRLRMFSARCTMGQVKPRIKNPICLEEPWLKRWHEMTIKDFMSEETPKEIETQVKKLVDRNDRRGLRRFASALFGGYFGVKSYLSNETYMKLVCNFRYHPSYASYPAKFLSIEEMGKTVIEVFHMTKKEIIGSFESLAPRQKIVEGEFVLATAEEREKSAKDIYERRSHYRITDIFIATDFEKFGSIPRVPFSANPEKGYDPEEEVWITHGGGYDNLCNFLGGRTQGYRLTEGDKPGIQVHPHRDRRKFSRMTSEYYARKGAGRSLDRPCILFGRIKAKYLDHASNWHEAGLRAEFVPFLTRVSLEPLPVDSRILQAI